MSYTRTPDAALAREVERFLESFHTAEPPGLKERLCALRVCVDGSDFSMPPIVERKGRVREVLDVVYDHLGRSRELLVLCSTGSARSDWVEKEIRWFIQNFGAGGVRIAFTEGEAPWKEPEKYCPPAILEYALHKGIAYDLRGYDKRRAKVWYQVPEFSREMVRLAADLHGRSAGELYPSWLEAELDRARRQSVTMASNARFETFAGDPARAVLAAYEAHQLHPSDRTERVLREAYRAAVMHHHNRRQLAQITGSGPSYLAGRWKQGDVFTKTSADGRYRLLVTERGQDGPQPPGEVFLLNNETLRAVQLQPPNPPGARVEEVAFDRGTERVLVTRYFDLCVYDMSGGLVGTYPFSRYTKSPVHLLDGFLNNRWILGAETKGGVWLVDLTEPDATITVHPEFYRDATIFTDLSPDRRHMTLVYESGKANLLELASDGQPRLLPIPGEGVLYAGFPTAEKDRLVTTDRGGRLRLFEISEEKITEVFHSDPLGADIDWVSWSPESKRFALVGGVRQIYIAEGESGLSLATLDYGDTIDWRDAISMPVPQTYIEPDGAWDPGEGIPFPNGEFAVSALGQTGDQTWVLTEEWQNEYWPTRRLHLLADGRAHFLVEGYGPIDDYGDLFMLASHHLFVRVSQYLRPFPKKSYPECVLRTADAVWVGTRAGAFRKEGDRFQRITPANVSVEGLSELDGTIWMRGRTGAYAFTDGKLLRLTDPFVRVRSIQKADGSIWILAEGEAGGGGPVWRVNNWYASAISNIPNTEARVTHILESTGSVWLADRTMLHRVRGDDVRSVEINFKPSSIVYSNGAIWCTTQKADFFGGAGPLVRVDCGSLELSCFNLTDPTFVHARRSLFVTHIVGSDWTLFQTPTGPRAIASLEGDRPEPLELHGAAFQGMTENEGKVWLLTSAEPFCSREAKLCFNLCRSFLSRKLCLLPIQPGSVPAPARYG